MLSLGVGFEEPVKVGRMKHEEVCKNYERFFGVIADMDLDCFLKSIPTTPFA